MVNRFNGRIADILKTQRFRLGANADALRGLVQPPIAAISAAKQNTHADNEAVVPN